LAKKKNVYQILSIKTKISMTVNLCMGR